jgi:hypothetical protein
MKLRQLHDLRTVFGKGGVLDQLPNPSIDNSPPISKIKKAAFDAYVWAVRRIDANPVKLGRWKVDGGISVQFDSKPGNRWSIFLDWCQDEEYRFTIQLIIESSPWNLRKIVAGIKPEGKTTRMWSYEKETDPTIQRDIWTGWSVG